MYRVRAGVATLTASALLIAAAGPAAAQEQAAENASCMGLGSSFYGQFAPQQRAFVAAFVNGLEGPGGAYYAVFAREKEGGSIPAPCGTRLE